MVHIQCTKTHTNNPGFTYSHAQAHRHILLSFFTKGVLGNRVFVAQREAGFDVFIYDILRLTSERSIDQSYETDGRVSIRALADGLFELCVCMRVCLCASVHAYYSVCVFIIYGYRDSEIEIVVQFSLSTGTPPQAFQPIDHGTLTPVRP